jgi:hypothetical protein
MKVSELSGALLDYWVAMAQGNQEVRIRAHACEMRIHPDFEFMSYSPSTAWAHGGPIIERDQIFLQPPSEVHYNGGPNHGWRRYDHWRATVSARTRTLPPANETQEALKIRPVGRGAGETPLIAAMRAKVASHYGDEVPDAAA